MSRYFNASHVWDPASAPSVLDPTPTSLDEVRARHVALFEHGIQSGRFEAFVLPYSILHIILFLLYFILVPPSWLDAKAARGSSWRRWRRWILIQAKYPLYLLFVWRTVVVISVCRSSNSYMMYRVGLGLAFAVWWFAALFVFREPRFDCMRLEKEKNALDGSSAPVQKAEASTSSTVANGHGLSGSGVHSRCYSMATKPAESGTCPTQESRQEYRYYWQGLPPTLGHRALWVMDLIMSTRGAGWTHQVRTLPVPPPEALAQLPASSPRLRAKPRRVEMDGPNARARLLRHYLTTIASSYVLVDLFWSILVVHDPYYSGLVDAPFPPGLLLRFLSESPIFVRCLRTLVSGLVTFLVLMINFTALLALMLVCTHEDDVKAESWMWADVFGDPRAILDHGLTGLWGESWHQGLRITLSALTGALSTACGWRRRDVRAQVMATVSAFFISGVIHSVGSYMQLGDNQPIRPFFFFAVQGVGIMAEVLAAAVFSRLGLRLPEGFMRVVRGAWVVAFMCLTGPLFADDMAKGGDWLSEPLPFSFVGGLGLGAGWSTLGVPRMWWHTGDVWWKSGVAL